MATASPEEFADLFKDHQIFSIDLYKEMCKDNENLVLCPTTVFAVLSMLGVGARGNTAAQLTEALKVPSVDADSEVHDSFRKLILALDCVDPENVEMAIVTTLYLNIGYSLIEVFAETLSHKYFSSVQYADFQNKEAAVEKINTLIAEETNNKIENMVSADLFDENTRLVVTNAVYMKGTWDSKFLPEKTSPDSFHLLDGSVRQVDMMHHEGWFRITYIDKLQSEILEMPYRGLEFSMNIILPDNSDAFSKLEKSLDVDCLETLLSSLAMPTTVSLRLPRFQAEVSTSLHEVLPKLGIDDLFSSDKSDLSGMSAESLFVSVMLNKTFITVDEDDSEVSAAAVAGMRAHGGKMDFWVNRPFLYIIRHIVSGAIMFMGRMTSPPESSLLSS